MEEVLREHLGEIALLIYILYPLLKRWWNRNKKKSERAAKAPPPTRATKTAPATGGATRPSEADFLAAAQSQLERLKEAASLQLARAESDPRLLRLAPTLHEDVLGRLGEIERSIRSRPTLSTVVQDTDVLRGLEALLRDLKTMAQRRIHRGSPFLAVADEVADACYAPLLELAQTHGLDLRTSQPLVVPGDWERSIVPRFASTRVAPLRVPAGFEDSLWRWPAIAQEVARDFFYSVEDLDGRLHARLGLPEEVSLPISSTELDGSWLRKLFGPWLPEIFADAIGTILLGPAHVEAMLRALRNPASAQRTAAIFQSNGRIDEHPPARLRLYMATRVLHHLGRHQEADTLWKQWESEHSDVGFYYLPLGGQWVGLSDEALHTLADSLIDVLLQQGWPELDGFQLLNIPGLAYLHAEHAEVVRLAGSLARGQTVAGNARLILAAAVLAATAQPTLHDEILDAARRSIVEVLPEPTEAEGTRSPRPRYPSIGRELIGSLNQARALDEAIAVAAAFTPYGPPSWHSRRHVGTPGRRRIASQ